MFVDILSKNKNTLEIWNVFYPVRSSYLPIFTTKMINAALKENPNMKILNNLNLQNAKTFYIN